MMGQFLLSVVTIPSGFFILIGFFALIVLAIALWKSPKDTSENPDLEPEHADSSKTKE
jgi:hypothetical protein